jgi:hypothetical protein
LSFDAGEDDGEVDWLGDVVVGAEFERLHQVVALAEAGHHHDRQRARGVAGANLLEHLEAGHARHVHVEQHEVRAS